MGLCRGADRHADLGGERVGFDWWPLAARGDIIFPLGIWLLTPWITRNLGHGGAPPRAGITLPLWVGVAAGMVVLAIGLASNYHDIDGSIARRPGSRRRRRRPRSQPKIGTTTAARSSANGIRR